MTSEKQLAKGIESAEDISNEKIDDRFFTKHINNNLNHKNYWQEYNEDEYLLHAPEIKIINMHSDATGNYSTRKACNEIISKQKNEKSGCCEYEKVGILLGLVIVTLCFHMCTTSLIVKTFLDYFDLNSQFVINFSLQNTPFLPANLSYGWDEAYVHTYDKSYAVVFSHNNLEYEPGNSLKVSVGFKRLFPLLRYDYKNYSTNLLVSGTGLSALITVILEIALYIVAIYCRNDVPKNKTYYLYDIKSELSEIKQARLILAILHFILLFHLVVSPSLIYFFTEYVLDIPLKMTSSLPARLSYSLDEAFVFRIDNCVGLLFIHDLIPTVDNLHTSYVSFTPLVSLIRPNCISCNMIDPTIIALYLSALFSASFWLFIIILYKIIGVCFRNYPQ